ncbi:hypothetical protein [Arthrobacter sp. NicSoilC12]|uniref:hypothetical protein n=1 Tax=Arthrobacter sp. NicSoilC12 TaxID=2831001 RepID=UPI001CC7A702|nr:hypothetical protein [Arthrobacter sp. NicSoilC12]GIU55659.1 hypothetical protein NicSoilC12_14080 [Arthrobacter sp. NicSoilC12]
MNVEESMAAYRDGTFETKAKDSAQRRLTAKDRTTKSSVQKGRDLYQSMYPTKKEQ